MISNAIAVVIIGTLNIETECLTITTALMGLSSRSKVAVISYCLDLRIGIECAYNLLEYNLWTVDLSFEDLLF